MYSFFITCYIISLVLSVITLIVGIFVGIKRIHTFRVLPRALRLYLLTCCYPYFFLYSICSIYIGINYLLHQSVNQYFTEVLRNVTTFSTQQIRNVFTLLVFERIVATVKLEKYTAAGKDKLFWALNVFSYVTSSLYIGYVVYAKSFPDIPILSNLTTYYAYCAHIFMLSVCAILYLMNRRMYKFSAYKITLKRRYTIAQNIKSLAYLFPSIIIYSLLAQFGSMITIIFQVLQLPPAPSAVYHISSNLSFLFIYLQLYFNYSDKHKVTVIKNNVKTVKNPLGKNIPINVTTDQYFHELQNRWI